MKSKRKEVNKFKNKQQTIDSQQDNQEIIKRATGVKPFHLSKIRMHKRHSQEFLNKKVNLNIIADRYVAKNQNTDRENVYLDLIIKKKLLVDVQRNVKLQSQRKNLLYQDLEQNCQDETMQFQVDDLNRDETEFNNVNTQNLQAFKSQDLTNNLYKHKRSLSKCQCCQEIQGYSTQAVICRVDNRKDSFSPSQERSNSQHSQNVIDTKIELRNILQKASKSPFSFTNVKWRSKSELAVVDKWKQKYEKSNEFSNPAVKKYKSVQKIIASQLQQKAQFSARKKLALQKMVRQKQKLIFPSINKESQMQINSQPQQFVKQVNKMQAIIEEKKESRQKKKQNIKQVQIKISSQPLKKNKQQSEIFVETQNKIVIKEMYTKKQLQPQIPPQQIKITDVNQQEGKQKEDRLLSMIKFQKQRNKKIKALRSKFPQIKVSTFYSTKEKDDQKKIKLHNLQKVISQSNLKPKKKVYFVKQLEQIPERWQYGQSRQHSREEVQHYLSIKKQEEELWQIRAMQQQQKQRLLEIQEQTNWDQAVSRKESVQAIQESLINKCH